MKTEKLYQNKDWLYKKYWDKKLSAYQIAKICEVTSETIRIWLKRFDISRRSISEATHLSEANHCNLVQKAVDWIYGELLGDGCLQSHSPFSANFQYGSKHLEYIKYVSKTLQSFGIEQSGKIREKYDKKWNSYAYQYASLSYVELLPIRKQWYPEGKKIVPKDIELTPLTCRQWVIGDGSLKHEKKRRPHIILATYGFVIEDVKWLVGQLIKLGFKATRQPNNNSIRISQYSTKDFLDYIGKCPVECYQYKWAYG